MSSSPVVRLAHLSDIHITANPLGWRRQDYFSRRLTGWINYRWLGRRQRFRRAPEVLAALVAELRERQPDRIIFSGDATALGLEAELARAAALFGLGTPAALPGLAVPGNHDYYTRGDAASGLFERYFAPWQTGERVDDAPYPFAQQVGPLWLVAVNSSSGNAWAWDASGRVDREQLDRLERLLARLGPGRRILVTHFPLCLASGKRERRTHGLRNLQEVIGVAARGRVCLWLHGHRHGAYHLFKPDLAPFPIVCTGSATQTGLWSYSEYTIADDHFQALRRSFSPNTGQFEACGSFGFRLPDF
jgi:3',5'-cyclic AMP phosphodiesterase CpdA